MKKNYGKLIVQIFLILVIDVKMGMYHLMVFCSTFYLTYLMLWNWETTLEGKFMGWTLNQQPIMRRDFTSQGKI